MTENSDVAALSDDERNEIFCAVADEERWAPDCAEGGKTLPYIGWFWRSVRKSGYSIGHCGVFRGFMENNKWAYSEVYLTGDDAAPITEALDGVIAAWYLPESDTRDAAIKAACARVWAILQMVKIGYEDPTPYWREQFAALGCDYTSLGGGAFCVSGGNGTLRQDVGNTIKETTNDQA